MRGVRRRYGKREQGSEGPVGGRRMMGRAGLSESWTPPNKRMHATRDTRDVIYNHGCGRARDARR